jgi:biopolymer transport protein ExbD
MCRSTGSRPRALVLLALLAAAPIGCDEPSKPGGAASAAPAASTAPATTAPTPAPEPAPKPKTMPELTVDEDGPYLGGQRVKLSDADGAAKLAKIVGDLPIEGKPVVLIADKRAKVSNVAAVVTALGEAGAPKVTIKTEGRKDLPHQIDVTPESRVASPPACSVVVTVLKDLSTAIWPVKGGRAKKQRKGLAGPDLSHTGEQLEKDLAHCESTMAFFSGDESLGWELAFNLAGTVLNADGKKRVDTLVLLREEPVAGREVTVGKH